MKDSLLPGNFDLELFLKEHENLKGVGLAEKLKRDFGKYSAFLGEQIKLTKKADAKLPAFAMRFCLFTSKSLEQASSEALAEFKARRCKGNRLLDLTGGLGADDAAFSKSFKKIVSVDNDFKLNEIARYNFVQLGLNNVDRVDADACEFIDKNNAFPKPEFGKEGEFGKEVEFGKEEEFQYKGEFDLIYIDSDRRVKEGKKKSVTLHDSEPSVLELKGKLFKISDCILLKLSPLIDLTYLAKSLPEIERIYIVSLNNEVKEILAVLNKYISGIPEVIAVDISRGGIEKEFFGLLREKTETQYAVNDKYFYDPANSLIKSGLVTKYAKQNNLKLIGKNSSYMLGRGLVADFFGRKFEIISQIEFSKSRVKKYLQENCIQKATVSKRDFPVSALELSKLFSPKEGGEDYLFFTQRGKNEKLMYHTRKISNTAKVPSQTKSP